MCDNGLGVRTDMSKSLDAILAARKAQMQTSVATDLRLRSGQEQDSDDDDDDSNTQGTEGAVAVQSSELLLGRAENMLRDPSAATRKKTITSLENAQLSADQLKPLLRALLLRFSDDSERCRDGAVGLFRRWQSQCKDASECSGALPFLMPVMVERLGTEKVTEPSEDVRAALVMLMRDVLLRCKKLVRPYIAEVGAIALGCARDNHPEVIKGLCELVATISAEVLQPMCKEMSPKQVKPFSEKLIGALLPHITHRHGAVRLQVLGALEELLLCGAGSAVETLTGWRLKNNVPVAEFYGKGSPRINYLADLSRDRQVGVRRKFVQVVARWIREMDGEDLYEQEVRIMPYLVSGLTDEDDETAHTSMRELERLGEKYIETNMKDYKERIEYGYRDDDAYTASLTLPLPAPFTKRPPLGARERVKQHFRSLIHPICAELEAWTGKERLQSARLLEVLIAYSEDSVTEFVHQLLPALAKCMDGGELKGLEPAVGRCAALLAQHIDPDEYLPLLVGHANSDNLNTLSQRMQHVQLLPHLLRGVKPPMRAKALRGLAPLLADRPFVCTQHTLLRAAVRAALEHAISCAATLPAGATPPLASLGPMLLHAAATHLASSPTLQPKVTTLSDGLEDVSDADDASWHAAAVAATAMAQPLDAVAPGGRAWGAWRPAVLTVLRREEDEVDDEFAVLARKLVEGHLAQADAPVVVEDVKPRKALVIDEGDFTDEEDSDDDKSADKTPEGGFDHFEDELD